MSAQEKEIADLRDSMSAISLQLTELVSVVQKQQSPVAYAYVTAPAAPLQPIKVNQDKITHTKRTDGPTGSQNRKSNLVVYDVNECSKGTPWFTRAKEDMDNILADVDAMQYS